MVYVNNKEMKKREFLKYFGDISQFCSAVPAILDNGKSAAVKTIFVKTGTGLEFAILPSRGLDIAWASYGGRSLSFISKTGITHPHYYEEQGLKWLRSFYAGFLTTCGITYMGAPCVDLNEPLGLHGRYSNAETEDLCVSNDWVGDEIEMTVSGKVREAAVFGENMVLRRKIKAYGGKNIIEINDEIENLGFKPTPLMNLYHCNFGYPLLSSVSKLLAPVKENGVKPRDKEAEANNGVKNYNMFQEPTQNYKEQVFFIDLKKKPTNETLVALVNESINIGVSIRFNINDLPWFIEWKQMGESDYVVGLEPGLATPLGRSKVRELGQLINLEPGATHKINLKFEVLTNQNEINAVKKEISTI